MKRSWKLPAIIICVVVLVGSAGYFGYNALTKTANKTAQNYMKVKAIKGTIAVTVTASGTAASGVSKDILAQNSGTMGSFNVKPGDNVKSGQSIGNIVDQNSAQSLQKAQNTLAQDNLKLAQLKKSLDTLYIKSPVSGTIQSVNASIGDDASLVAKVLHAVVITYTGNDGKTMSTNVDAQSGVISSIYVSAGATVSKGDNLFKLSSEDINNSIASQNINIQQDQASLSNAQTQAGYNNLLSPINGTVAALNFNPGDTIQAGKTIGTIIDLTQMQTVVAVDELDIDKVTVGQKATVTIDAIMGKSFTGQVLKISSIGKTTNSVTTYDVVVSIDNATGVKTGMTTNVSISVQSKDNVVMLPIEAVQGSGSSRFVTVETTASASSTTNTTNNTGNTRKGNSSGYSGSGSQGSNSKSGGGITTSIASNGVTRKRVQVGIANQNYIEITSGVDEGDTVLVQIIKNTTSTTKSTTNPLSGASGAGGYGGGGGNRGGQ